MNTINYETSAGKNKVKKKEKSKRVEVRLDPREYEIIKTDARDKGLPIAQVLRNAYFNVNGIYDTNKIIGVLNDLTGIVRILKEMIDDADENNMDIAYRLSSISDNLIRAINVMVLVKTSTPSTRRKKGKTIDISFMSEDPETMELLAELKREEEPQCQ